MNLCRTCDRDFGGVRAFDIHRVGTFEPLARRCMTDAEMRAAGLEKKTNGTWGRLGPAMTGR